jgi:hypothetical protein
MSKQLGWAWLITKCTNDLEMSRIWVSLHLQRFHFSLKVSKCTQCENNFHTFYAAWKETLL